MTYNVFGGTGTLSLTQSINHILTCNYQGRIIHEAGKAEASGPGPREGPGPPGITKIYKVGPLWAPKFLERKFAVF